ncbi:MAG: hypothetical protein AAF804_10390 [Bacteroidota bacterium]
MSACVTTQPAEFELNADFEKVESNLPAGWEYVLWDSSAYAIELDELTKRQGRYALKMQALVDSPRYWGAIVAREVPVWFKMREVKLRGYVKREGIERGLGGLWAKIDHQDGYPVYHEQGDWELPPTEDWTWYELSFEMGASAQALSFGGILTGPGTLWLDSLTLDIDGVPYGEAAQMAAQTNERLIAPTLAAVGKELPTDRLSPDLRRRVQSSRLVQLRMAHPGERSSLRFLQNLIKQGDFDFVMLDVGQLLDPRGPLIPYWPETGEWQEVLTEISQDPTQKVIGVALNDPMQSLDRLEPHLMGEEAQVAWKRFDSLHHCLYEDLGQTSIAASTIDYLIQVRNGLSPFLADADSATQLAWDNLVALETYYRSNGSEQHHDQHRLDRIGQLMADFPGARALLILPAEAYRLHHNSLSNRVAHSLAHLNPLKMDLTFGEGQVLSRSGEIERLPTLLPQNLEYYLQRHRSAAAWYDWSQYAGWWPQSLATHAYPLQADADPHILIRPTDHVDITVYLGEASPAHPQREKLKR